MVADGHEGDQPEERGEKRQARAVRPGHGRSQTVLRRSDGVGLHPGSAGYRGRRDGVNRGVTSFTVESRALCDNGVCLDRLTILTTAPTRWRVRDAQTTGSSPRSTVFAAVLVFLLGTPGAIGQMLVDHTCTDLTSGARACDHPGGYRSSHRLQPHQPRQPAHQRHERPRELPGLRRYLRVVGRRLGRARPRRLRDSRATFPISVRATTSTATGSPRG